MAPKTPKTPKTGSNESDPGLLTLIHLISTADEFKVNMDAMAKKTGLAQSKNVPRKINSVIGPLGYEFMLGKIIEKQENDVTNTGDSNGDGEAVGTPESKAKHDNITAKAGMNPKTSNTPNTAKAKAVNGGAKKRKLDDADTGPNNDDGDIDDDEVKGETSKGEEVIEGEVKDDSKV